MRTKKTYPDGALQERFYTVSLWDMHDASYDADKARVTQSFLSKLTIKKKTRTEGIQNWKDVLMLDVVKLRPRPEEIFVVYYITVDFADPHTMR